MMNRLWNMNNHYQHMDRYSRVLCLCSAGLLRSPTAAVVLSGEPFNFNTRAAGVEESYALVPVDEVLIQWADQIVCMTKDHKQILVEKFGHLTADKTIHVLEIPDNFAYRDKKLVKMIKERYVEVAGWTAEPKEPLPVPLTKEKSTEE